MTINHEVKGQLAKLLATEDLVVEHRSVETAQFNVQTRVLTLPQWNKASNTVYDLLVGHEVGHALYTPNEDWSVDRKIPPQIVNVVEDARIEKMMKRRYAGLSKTFYRGYEELADEDFFGIEDEDLTTFNLADKINLFCKIGNYVDIPFTDKENELLLMVRDCETFTEVLDASEAIYNYCKDEQQPESPANVQLQSNNGGSSPQPQGSDSEEGESEPAPSNNVEGSDDTDADDIQRPSEDVEEKPTSSGGNEGDVDVTTMKSFEDAIKDLISEQELENQYLEIPKVDLSAVIIPNDEVYQYVPEFWDNESEKVFEEVDARYAQFKKSAQKEVNYLVKEFECRKSASAYARSTTSRTGVLDCAKLHTYKYNEDLFKKVSVIPDGKNHGLIFILDWSGSMCDVLMDTVKQLYNLIWFCKKCSIPFEVYAFTSDFPKVKYYLNEDGERRATYPKDMYKKRDGFMQVYETFSLMNMFSSKSKIKDLEYQMKTIYRIAEGFNRSYYTFYPIPTGLTLSGTPLNDTLICMHEIIPQFKRNNHVEKVQCVILTDGEAPPLKYHKTVQRHWEKEPYLGVRQVSTNCILRDRKLGTTYLLDGQWYQMTDSLLTHLKDKFTDTNFIGIRVLEGRDAHSFIARYYGRWNDDHDRIHAQWRKERSFTITNSGYHSYFAMSATSLAQDNTFEVKEDATKSQIKSAFVKSLRTKKMNKRVLNEFISLVA
tara:strand:- start:19 stop:2163 length:2145 start_codon:yes stop_codon:yes gene_type:complete